jgi:hypothetical protein
LDSLEGASSATLWLEDERKKDKDARQRIQEEAARIQPLHHGHHRAAKQPKLELPSVVKAGD